MPGANGRSFPGIPLPPEPWCYSRRFIEAMQVAALMHAAQMRKGTRIPYVSHLVGTCAIALDHGASEDEAIAALLHDAIEDVSPVEAARAAVGQFGPEVLRIVESCTQANSEPKVPWRERRERYVRHLGEEDRSVLLVSGSDKLHNARAIVADLRTIGAAVWDRFSVPRGDTLWYYRALVTAFRRNPVHTPTLIDELDRVVTEMEHLAARG